MPQRPPDEETRREIRAVTWRLLRDAGATEPPVLIPGVVGYLELHQQFYDLQDPSFLDRAKHRVMVHGRRLVDIVRKIKLSAVLLYDEDRIVLDGQLPKRKHDWATSHEVGHRVLPWHKPYFYGDTAQTLDPDWQEMLEAEANYAASEIMFCGPVFDREARDLVPSWSAIDALVLRHSKSLTTTLRRYVERNPEHAMAMLVSTPCWLATPVGQQHRWRHFVVSPRFASEFAETEAGELARLVDANASRRRGGPVADFGCKLCDTSGDRREFHAESFFNSHDILTLFAEARQGSRIVRPGAVALRERSR